ncbi:MAG: SpoIID/LytB domain-containing protein [Candidatus Riflebacteria bacterium]|nr:SpoIID/LytB domain-containing protein [Candidatus Riflebacteria bacterium]
MKQVFYILLLEIFIFFPCQNAYSQAKSENLDNKQFKIGLLRDHEISTLRMQATAGNWNLTCTRFASQNASGTSTTDVLQIELPEGEDATIQTVSSGIFIKTSNLGEIRGYFSKIEASDGWLLNLDLPNIPDFLTGGGLEIFFSRGNVLINNNLRLYEYLCSVVSQMQTCEPEALKAQIIAVRTFCMATKSFPRHATESFDLCSTDHCMSYIGKGDDRELVDVLIADQKNRVMLHQGKYFFPMTTHTCSGRLSSIKEVFGKEDTIHISQDDRIDSKSAENCMHSPFFNWIREISEKDMTAFLSDVFSTNPRTTINEWIPLSSDQSGRINVFRIKGKIDRPVPNPPLLIDSVASGTDFFEKASQWFGQNAFPSLRFTVESLTQTNIITGKGKGHGAGMCLIGADGMAKRGFKFNEILNFYYKNITFSPAVVQTPNPAATSEKNNPSNPPSPNINPH